MQEAKSNRFTPMKIVSNLLVPSTIVSNSVGCIKIVSNEVGKMHGLRTTVVKRSDLSDLFTTGTRNPGKGLLPPCSFTEGGLRELVGIEKREKIDKKEKFF